MTDAICIVVGLAIGISPIGRTKLIRFLLRGI
jgi:hypothetical protein